MRCLPKLHVCRDKPFWVSRESFYQHFDQVDFLCRASAAVTPLYLAEWFHTPDDGIPRFNLPTFAIVTGKTHFINGRHRTAVLLNQCQKVPVAFVFAMNEDATKTAQDLLLLERWQLRSLEIHEFIELPDLPIVERLP